MFRCCALELLKTVTPTPPISTQHSVRLIRSMPTFVPVGTDKPALLLLAN